MGKLNKTIKDAPQELVSITNMICSHTINRWFGHWKYCYDDPLKFLNYEKDLNGKFVSKGIVNKAENEYMPFFVTEYATKNKTNETGNNYFDNELYFEGFFIDLDDHKDWREAIRQGVILANWFDERGVTVLLNYSGNKGCHLTILTNPINIKHPLLVKQKFIDKLSEITQNNGEPITLTTIDEQVKNKLGLRAIPLSRHRKTRNYLHFIDYKNPNYIEYIERVKTISPAELFNDEDYFIPQVPNLDENTRLLESKIRHLDMMSRLETNTPKYFKDTLNYKDNINLDTKELNERFKELESKFKILHTTGQRMKTAWRLIHMLRRSNYNKDAVKNFFKTLDSGAYIENNYEYEIDRAYILKPNTDDKLGGMTALIEGIEKYAPSNQKEGLIEYFGEFFSTKPKEINSLHFGERDIKAELIKDYKTTFVKYYEINKGYDLILYLNENLLKIQKTENKETLGTIEFTYKNGYFDIKDKNLKSLNELLEFNKFEPLPSLIVFAIREHLRANEIYANKGEDKPKNWEDNQETMIKRLFKFRNNKDLARKELAKYLNNELGLVLQWKTNEPYILNPNNNSYDPITIDEIITTLNNNELLEKNSIHTKDVEYALGFIGERVKPQYNKIKFNNGIYDLDNFEFMENVSEPIMTMTQTKYNYNPNAQADENLLNYLNTSLSPISSGDIEKDKAKLQNNIELVYQIVGYSLISGNPKQALIIIVGKTGGGKGVLDKLLTDIHGTDRVARIQLQALTVDKTHETSNFLGKKINMVSDSSNAVIEDAGIIKQTTGNDPIDIEPKFKDKITLPAEEVPTMIIFCNNPPKFKGGIDDATITRIVLLEFLHQFRNTDDEILNLDKEIIKNPSNMEYLIYQSIEAIKPLITEGKNFNGRISDIKTRELLGKHTEPINYLLGKLVYFEDDEYLQEVQTKELNQTIVELSDVEGLNLTNLDKHNRIKSYAIVGAIKNEFDGIPEDFKSKQVKIDKENVRVYPYLKKTDYFKELLEKKNSKHETEKNTKEEQDLE